MQVSACVAPANMPCQIFFVTAVPPSMLRLEPVAGSAQVLPAGRHFQPVTVRVVDSAVASHPVLGANVTFQVVVSRPATAPPPVSIGGIIIGKNPPPVIVSSSQTSVRSDGLGLSTLQPSAGAAQGALVVQGTAAAGSQRSSLPATISVAGSALVAAGLVAPSAGHFKEERPEAGRARLPWQSDECHGRVDHFVDFRQLVGR